MLNLNYKDLLYLRKLLQADHSDNADFVLNRVNAEIDLVNPIVAVVCGKRTGSDLILLNERAFEQKIQILARSIDVKPLNVVVQTPNDHIAHMLYQRAKEVQPVHGYSDSLRRLEFKNGTKVSFIAYRSVTNQMRGQTYDLGVVYTLD